MIEQAIKAVSTNLTEKEGNNINSKIDHTIRVNGGHIEQHNLKKNFLSTSIIVHIESANDKEYYFSKILQSAQRPFLQH